MICKRKEHCRNDIFKNVHKHDYINYVTILRLKAQITGQLDNIDDRL